MVSGRNCYKLTCPNEIYQETFLGIDERPPPNWLRLLSRNTSLLGNQMPRFTSAQTIDFKSVD